MGSHDKIIEAHSCKMMYYKWKKKITPNAYSANSIRGRVFLFAAYYSALSFERNKQKDAYPAAEQLKHKALRGTS